MDHSARAIQAPRSRFPRYAPLGPRLLSCHPQYIFDIPLGITRTPSASPSTRSPGITATPPTETGMLRRPARPFLGPHGFVPVKKLEKFLPFATPSQGSGISNKSAQRRRFRLHNHQFTEKRARPACFAAPGLATASATLNIRLSLIDISIVNAGPQTCMAGLRARIHRSASISYVPENSRLVLTRANCSRVTRSNSAYFL